MPVMIVILPDAIPGIYPRDDYFEILETIATLPGAPPAASESIREARLWLATLQRPSGLYDSEEEAQAAAQSVTKGRQ